MWKMFKTKNNPPRSGRAIKVTQNCSWKLQILKKDLTKVTVHLSQPSDNIVNDN